MKTEAVSLEAVHTHTHIICLINKNIKDKIIKKLIQDSNSLKMF